MAVVTKREEVHALVDRYPDEALDELAAFLSCRRAADGTDLSAKAILTRGGARRMTAEESEAFWREYGPQMQPPDGEG